MSCAHQIYLHLPEYQCQNPQLCRPERNVMVYHHEIWGQKVIRFLGNFLDYWNHCGEGSFEPEKYRQFHFATEAGNILRHCYSFDPSIGYLNEFPYVVDYRPHQDRHWYESNQPVCNGKALRSPFGYKCQNDSGITIIDISQEQPAYCFMGISGEKWQVTFSRFGYLCPINAERYAKIAYPKMGKPIIMNTDYNPPREEDWTQFHNETRRLVERLSPYRVLNREDMPRIFPDVKWESAPDHVPEVK